MSEHAESEIVLVNFSGTDRPGITASLMGILAGYDVRVLDIGQAMIQDTLALGILIKLPDAARSAPVLKDLLFEAHKLDLRVRFTPVSGEEYERWVVGEPRQRYVLTLLGRRVTALQIARIAGVVTAHGLNIEDIVRLSGRSALHDDDRGSRACLELTLRGEPADADAMKAEFLSISEEMDVDISFQEDNFYRRNRRLVVFDMDSTLIREEVIDELAWEAGAGEAVSRVTAAAMRGEIDFSESLRQRVALLEGLEESVLERVAERLTLTEGAERLLKTLRTLGYRTAVISGGFDYFGRRLQRRLRLDYVHANRLEIVDGRLTGRVLGEIVDGERKAALLREIAAEEGIELAQVIAVGDGANDLPMLRVAGLGIAFHAKPLVQKSARQAISTIGLDGVLYLMGMKDAENPH
ncbi:phosphoserine phosphatase SerB [Sediminicurvatus halobius]|uniref:Phosphoserine phosphatase n=1 Tax=Sediminicurvatus halobius TaxID=2182432 RepID=A0A2U2N602_9GAMM|nr:phosphoserine phosphatase SerB [Spiribacter halobius]PWG64606.1 phosphoserine phosphatase SerB [Spiribacter halobius]UEX79071.1 phosphoserine phosphatase SerB [Spiribacter halobius]